jgi:uncharacterized membrane protein
MMGGVVLSFCAVLHTTGMLTLLRRTKEVLPEKISRPAGETGFCYRYRFARCPGDRRSVPYQSNLTLLENGTPLRPTHSSYRRISHIGHGAYRHWGKNILFSTSDNTDPRVNGRRYLIRYIPFTEPHHRRNSLFILCLSLVVLIVFHKTTVLHVPERLGRLVSNIRRRAALSAHLPEIITPEKAFIACGLIFGTLFTLLNPPFQVPDESAHWWRAISIACGTIVATPHDTLSVSVIKIVQRFHTELHILVGSDNKLKKEHILSLFPVPLNPDIKIPFMMLSADLYNPIPYLPQIPGICIGYLMNMPPLVIFYFCRLLNLLVWLSLVYAAIRIAPLCRWGLFTLALMPMTIHQAASCSADSFSIGVSFLCIAVTLRFACAENSTLFSKYQIGLLSAILILAVMARMNPTLLLLLFIIPRRFFGPRYRYLLAIGSIFALVLLGILIWNHVNRWTWETFCQSRIDIVVPQRNLDFILHSPCAFAKLLIITLRRFWWDYVMQFVGRQMGWLNAELPIWIIYSYLAALLLSPLISRNEASLCLWQKAVIAGTFIVGALSIFVFLWITEAPKGITFINGIQGRYFIPFAPFLLVLLPNRILRTSSRILSVCLVAYIILADSAILTVLCTRYYGPVVVDSIKSCPGECGGTIGLNDSTRVSQRFVLRIPSTIRTADYEGYLLYKVRGEEDLSLLDRAYQKQADGSCYRLRTGCPAADVRRAESLFNTFPAFYNTVSTVKIRFEPGRYTADVILRLTESPDDPVPIAESRLAGWAITGQDWCRFEFKQVRLTSGKSYYITLESPTARPRDAAHLCAAAEDTYTDGEITVTGAFPDNTGKTAACDICFEIPVEF